MDTFTFMAWIVIVVFGGGAIIFVRTRLPIKEVLHLRPRDRRGQQMRVDNETDLGIVCKRVKGVTYRFIKRGSGWVFNIGGRMVTRFFGIEGSAYTAYAVRDNVIENVSVSDYLKFLLSDKFYDTIPDEQRRIIENDIIGVTIEAKGVDAEQERLPTLTTNMIDDEDERRMLSNFVSASMPKTAADLYKTIITLLLGAFAMYFLIKQNYL